MIMGLFTVLVRFARYDYTETVVNIKKNISGSQNLSSLITK